MLCWLGAAHDCIPRLKSRACHVVSALCARGSVQSLHIQCTLSLHVLREAASFGELRRPSLFLDRPPCRPAPKVDIGVAQGVFAFRFSRYFTQSYKRVSHRACFKRLRHHLHVLCALSRAPCSSAVEAWAAAWKQQLKSCTAVSILESLPRRIRILGRGQK